MQMPSLLLRIVVVAGLCLAGAECQAQEPQEVAPLRTLATPDAPKPQKAVMMINGRPYQRPTQRDLFHDYVKDTYGPTGFAYTSIRSFYSQARGKPSGWGQDWPGFGQRFGSAYAVTAINGTVRYGMEEVFREDLRYIPCHGCTAKHKVENALLAEITARHEDDGHRFFTLTPVVSDFSGPIITHTAWYPGASSGPLSGVISVRTVVATRVGIHVFREFVLERRHKDSPEVIAEPQP